MTIAGGGHRGTAVVAVPRPTATLVRRALRERRVMRQAQASQIVLSRRWVAAAAAASSVYCPVQQFQLEEMRRVVARSRRLAAQVSCRQHQQQGELQSTAAVATTSAAPSATLAPASPPPSSPSSLAPEPYFELLLSKRGRLPQKIDTVRAGYSAAPSAKQIRDYQAQPFLSDLARRGDIDGLRKAVEAGRGMDASNKFGESVVHIACRRGNLELLRFLLANGGSLTACDDLGRFPLHEVCWAAEPRFDIVRVFLDEEREANDRRRRGRCNSGSSSSSSGGGGSTEAVTDAAASSSSNNSEDELDVGKNGRREGAARGAGEGGAFDADRGPDLKMDLKMLLVTDKRGCSPLRYVKEDSWPQWRRFLDEVVDEYWPASG